MKDLISGLISLNLLILILLLITKLTHSYIIIIVIQYTYACIPLYKLLSNTLMIDCTKKFTAHTLTSKFKKVDTELFKPN